MSLIFQSLFLFCPSAGYRDIAQRTEISPGNPPDRPESAGGTEDGNIIENAAVKAAHHRGVSSGPEVEALITPNRPEAAGRPEDRGLGPG